MARRKRYRFRYRHRNRGIGLARPIGMLRVLFIATGIAAITGCRQNPEESATSQPAPPPAAALARQNLPLDQSLKELEKELSEALGKGMDGSAEGNILRAEAITDRLLESEIPFAWLTANAYDLSSYLRQIQALADRIMAQMRSGVDQVTVTREVTELRRKVIALRGSLARGGGNAPPTLDSLLAGYEADSTIITNEPGE
ncbi:MAG: hypothetical protein ACT4O1_05935 [Gemmatimonadota bacterium]